MKVQETLNGVFDGTVVLPDFQRSFIWGPEDVRELLVSVCGGYFIGSMLLLEDIESNSPFALRLIEGVEKVNPNAKKQSLVKILLDGQQRCTSLFYALYEPNLPLKDRKHPFKFYLDTEKALGKEWDDAVIGISIKDKKGLDRVNSNNNFIPFADFRDIGQLASKIYGNPNFQNILGLVNDFRNYEIHIIPLAKGTSLEKIAETFERINRTGEPLSAFELLTARLFRNDIRLRELLDSASEDYKFVKSVAPEFILKTVALIREKETKRKSILELDPSNFIEDWKRACKSLDYAFNRVTDIKNGYGVLDFKKWMPYATMLIPLAAMIDHVKTNKLEVIKNYGKIDRWYWTAVFSNRYEQSTDSISKSDYEALRKWIDDSSRVPDFIQNFDPSTIDLDVAKQSSAIYRGVMNLVTLRGALDFQTGQAPQFDVEKIQDDHIFPKSIYNDNCIANRTLISTNAPKGNKKSSEYFRQILEKCGEHRLKEILKSHLIPETALTYLLNDNIEQFKEERKQAIVDALREKLPDVS